MGLAVATFTEASLWSVGLSWARSL